MTKDVKVVRDGDRIVLPAGMSAQEAAELILKQAAEPEPPKVDGVALKAVLVRTRSAGVHFGYLFASSGTQAILQRARRIWSWKGANTLHEISLRGVDVAASRISEPVAVITLTEAIEIIPCTPAAAANLESAKWTK